MAETQNQPFQLSFNVSLKIDLQGSRVTSAGGLILVRELDDRLGFGELIAQHLIDSRRGRWEDPVRSHWSVQGVSLPGGQLEDGAAGGALGFSRDVKLTPSVVRGGTQH